MPNRYNKNALKFINTLKFAHTHSGRVLPKILRRSSSQTQKCRHQGGTNTLARLLPAPGPSTNKCSAVWGPDNPLPTKYLWVREIFDRDQITIRSLFRSRNWIGQDEEDWLGVRRTRRTGCLLSHWLAPTEWRSDDVTALSEGSRKRPQSFLRGNVVSGHEVPMLICSLKYFPR